MNLFKTVVGLFSSDSKAIDDVLDKDNGHIAKIGGWIGNLSYTEEEKAKNNKELMLSIQQFAKDTLSENTDRSKTRRELAVLTVKFYFLLIFFAVMTFKFDKEWSEFTLQVITGLGLTSLVAAVAAFFFGAYSIGAHIKGKK